MIYWIFGKDGLGCLDQEIEQIVLTVNFKKNTRTKFERKEGKFWTDLLCIIYPSQITIYSLRHWINQLELRKDNSVF